ncbi:DUF2231 domain-containing protein [soil metagenome]|nr:DUF2231 domain-containing protein [Trueperaceae bacterium]
MPKATLAGHPAHPQLVTFPLALFPFSLAMDVLHLVTGRQRYADAAHLAMEGAVAGSVVAATAGAMDYLEIPREHPAKPMARLHGGMNLALIALSVVNLGMRRRRRRPSTGLPVALSAFGTAALLGSAWYGAHLVYEHGVRVKGRGPLARSPSVAPPFDHLLEETLEAPLRKGR